MWRKWTLEDGCWRKGRVLQVARGAKAKGQNVFEDGWLFKGRSRKWLRSLPGTLRPSFLNCLMASTPDPPWLMNFLFIYSFHPCLSFSALCLDRSWVKSLDLNFLISTWDEWPKQYFSVCQLLPRARKRFSHQNPAYTHTQTHAHTHDRNNSFTKQYLVHEVHFAIFYSTLFYFIVLKMLVLTCWMDFTIH